MKFLIDECLHFTLAHVARARGHEAYHVNWLGLTGRADWNLITRIIDQDFTFVTNNARDFRKLYANQSLHAGVVIIVRQVPPMLQRRLFRTVLDRLGDNPALINEAIEIRLTDESAVEMIRYEHAGSDLR